MFSTKRRLVQATLLSALVVGAAVIAESCMGPSCQRELIVNVAYTGDQTGLLVVRHHGPGKRAYGFSIEALGPDADQLHQFGDECWAFEGSDPEPLGAVEAWIDLNRNDYQRCKDSTDRDMCAPEPGDPAVAKTFKLKKSGITKVDLIFGDM